MGKDWYLLQRPQVMSSGEEKDEFIQYAQDSFSEILEESFLGENVILYRHGNVDPLTALITKCVVAGNTPTAESKYESREIMGRIGELKIGNYVKYRGDFFLITSFVGNDQIYEKALMYRCNYNVSWITADGVEVIYPCVFKDSTRYSSGESENKTLVLGEVRIEMLLPKNEHTIPIARDKRFIVDDFDHAQVPTIDPAVYKITKTNLVQRTQKWDAVFVFVLSEDSFNPTTDSREKMIADYYNFLNVYSLELITPPTLDLTIGLETQIEVAAKINDQLVVDGVSYEVEDPAIVSVTNNGLVTAITEGQTTITVYFYDQTLEVEVNVVTIEPQNDVASISYSGDATLRVGSPVDKVFIANFYNSAGQKIDKIAAWTIVDDSLVENPSYITSKIGDNSISLRCHNKLGVVGRVIILNLSADGVDSDSIEIKLIPLT